MTAASARPWSAYGLRLGCSILLFVTGYLLIGGSTFALRMRSDAPVDAIVVGIAAAAAFLPLAFGSRYLGAFLVSCFIVSGLGAYWWTTIPWDELFRDNGFPSSEKPDLLDYALVATPTLLAAFYATVSRPSLLRADLANRGADPDEIRRAASVSFLSGAMLLVLCASLAAALWALMATGIVFAAVAPIRGIPALILVAALVAVAYGLLSRRVGRFRSPARAETGTSEKGGRVAALRERVRELARSARGAA